MDVIKECALTLSDLQRIIIDYYIGSSSHTVASDTWFAAWITSSRILECLAKDTFISSEAEGSTSHATMETEKAQGERDV